MSTQLAKLGIITMAALLSFSTAPLTSHAKSEIVMSSDTYSTHICVVKGPFQIFKRITELEKEAPPLTYFEPGTLVPDKELYQSVLDEIIDITYVYNSSFPNIFVGASIMEYPFLFTSASQLALTEAKMLEENKIYADEFSNVHVLWPTASAPQDILSTSPIKSLEDLKGKRIGVRTNAPAEIITLLGGVPILLPASDMYISLERGLVDGVLLPSPQYMKTKVIETAKHLTKVGILASGSAIVMNKKALAALPKNVQELIYNMSGLDAASLESAWIDDSAEEDIKIMLKEYGLTIHEISPNELNRWRERVAPMYKKWEANMVEAGHDPKAFRAELDKWREFYSNPVNVQAVRDEAEAKFFPGLFPPQ